MARLAVRDKSVTVNDEDSATQFIDPKGRVHRFTVQLGLDLKSGEVTGALVVDLQTDKEWFLLSEKRLQKIPSRVTE